MGKKLRFGCRHTLRAIRSSLAALSLLACNAALNLERFERDPEDAGSAPETAPDPSASTPDPSTPAPDPSASTPDASTPALDPDAPADDSASTNPEMDAAAPLPTLAAARVGSPCTSDAECTTTGPIALICFTSDSIDFPGVAARGASERRRGGPAGGYCSRTCLADGDCGSGARCLAHEGAARICFSSCDLGAPTAQCAGAAPQACVPVSDPDGGACYPLCTKDADCDRGRPCDAASGLCGDGLMRGDGRIGAPCTVATETNDCSSGLCWNPEGTGVGVCTALCRSSSGGCGTGADLEATATACLSDYVSPGAVGSCMRLCDADADCEGGYGCLLGSPIAGRLGYCLPGSFLGSVMPMNSSE
jgi:hypothetical protein